MNSFFKLYVTILFLSYSFVALPFDWTSHFNPFSDAQTSEFNAQIEDKIQNLEASNKSLRESNDSMNNELIGLQNNIQELEAKLKPELKMYIHPYAIFLVSAYILIRFIELIPLVNP